MRRKRARLRTRRSTAKSETKWEKESYASASEIIAKQRMHASKAKTIATCPSSLPRPAALKLSLLKRPRSLPETKPIEAPSSLPSGTGDLVLVRTKALALELNVEPAFDRSTGGVPSDYAKT